MKVKQSFRFRPSKKLKKKAMERTLIDLDIILRKLLGDNWDEFNLPISIPRNLKLPENVLDKLELFNHLSLLRRIMIDDYKLYEKTK